MQGVRGVNPQCSQKAMHSFPGGPLYPGLHTHRFNRGLCATVIFTIERNPLISGLCKLKPVLFKGQLYSSSRLQPQRKP